MALEDRLDLAVIRRRAGLGAAEDCERESPPGQRSSRVACRISPRSRRPSIPPVLHRYDAPGVSPSVANGRRASSTVGRMMPGSNAARREVSSETSAGRGSGRVASAWRFARTRAGSRPSADGRATDQVEPTHPLPAGDVDDPRRLAPGQRDQDAGRGREVERGPELVLEERLRLAPPEGGDGPIEVGVAAVAAEAVEQAQAGHEAARGRRHERLRLALGPAVGQHGLAPGRPRGSTAFEPPKTRSVDVKTRRRPRPSHQSAIRRVASTLTRCPRSGSSRTPSAVLIAAEVEHHVGRRPVQPGLQALPLQVDAFEDHPRPRLAVRSAPRPRNPPPPPASASTTWAPSCPPAPVTRIRMVPQSLKLCSSPIFLKFTKMGRSLRRW